MKKIFAALLGSLFLFSLSAIITQGDISFVPEVFAECTPEKIAEGIPCSDRGFNAPDPSEVNERINEPDFRTQVLKIVNYFLTFLGLLSVVAIVYAGILMVSDFGNEENAGKAKNIIGWAAAGIIIVLISFAFVNFVISSGDGVEGDGNSTTSGSNEDIDGDGIPDNIDNDITFPDNVIGTIDPSGIIDQNTYFLDQLEGLLLSIGKLDKNTADLLGLLDLTSSESFEEQFAQIQDALGDHIPRNDSYYDTLRKAMLAQGYEVGVIEAIIQKIQNGEALTSAEYDMIKNSLRYGFMIQRFEAELNILYESMPKTALNQAAYNDVITLLTEVRADPMNAALIQELQSAFKALKQVVASTPTMLAKITASPSTGSAPLIVSFDGTDSLDPNNQTIPRDNYTWTYYDQDGVERTIGTGPIVEHEFDEPGLFVVYLRVETGMEEGGYKTAMDGIAKVRIKVLAEASNLRTFINGKEVDSVVKVHIDDAARGVVFDASQSTAKIGRKITSYEWTFGDGSVDYSDNGDPIVHAYDEAGQYTVRLETKDNTGETLTKNIKVIVEHLSADIDVSPEEGNTNTVFEFDALDSKSSDLVIQEYLWEVFDDSGNLIDSEDDEDDFTFFPQQAGEYTVRLTIQDAQGNTSIDSHVLKVRSVAPTASFVVHKKSLSQPSTFVFDAASSNDAENDVLNFSWDFNGDGNFEIENSDTASIEWRYDQTGSYKPLLKVTDSYGESDTITQVINVESILDVDFEVQTVAVTTEQPVILSPNSSRAQAFYWDFGDGTQVSAGQETVEHQYNRAGTYTVRLTVFDQDDKENSVTKRIFVGDNNAPVAAYQIEIDGSRIFPEEDVCDSDIGITVNRRNNIKFMGTPSINTDGTSHMLNYTWNFGDGDFGTTKVASHRYTEIPEEGKCYEVTLAVKDRISAKSNSTEALAVKVVNIEPTLQKLLVTPDAGNSDNIAPLSVRLQAQGAFDPDGDIIRYRWWYRNIYDSEDIKQGVVQTQQPFASLTVESDGLPGVENEYIFEVEMTDNDGTTMLASDLLGDSPSMHVTNGNVAAPQVDFTMDKSQVYIGDTISFFANISGIPEADKASLSYEWDFDGDGIFDDSNSGVQVSRRFESPGEFDVRLRVKYKGLTSSKKHTVFVDNVNNYPLAAFVSEIRGLTLIVDGSPSKRDPSLENKTLKYSWDFDRFTDVNGDGNTSNDNESQSEQTEHTYDRPGTYTVTLTVTDARGSSNTVERRIDIRPNQQTEVIDDAFRPVQTKSSIQIQSRSNALTTLDLSLDKNIINSGDTTKITAKVVNADGSPYNGTVLFQILSGEAIMSSDIVEALKGQASTNITAKGTRDVEILVQAKDTFYETLEERIVLELRDN